MAMQPPEGLVQSKVDQMIWQRACQEAERLGKTGDQQFYVKLFKQIKDRLQQQGGGQQGAKKQPPGAQKSAPSPKGKSDDKSKSESDGKSDDKKDDKSKGKSDDKKDDSDKEEKEGALDPEVVAQTFEKMANYIENVEQRHAELREKEAQKRKRQQQQKAERLKKAIRDNTGQVPDDEAIEKLAKLDDDVLEDTLFQLETNDDDGGMAVPAQRQSKSAGKEDEISQLADSKAEEDFLRFAVE